jgi:hypothetical protein
LFDLIKLRVCIAPKNNLNLNLCTDDTIFNKSEMPNSNKVLRFKDTICTFGKNYASFNKNYAPLKLSQLWSSNAMISDSTSINKLEILWTISSSIEESCS